MDRCRSKNRQQRKEGKHEDRCRQAGFRFSPFILTQMGSLGPRNIETRKEITPRLATHLEGIHRSTYISELHQGLSINIFITGWVAQLRPEPARRARISVLYARLATVGSLQ